ncbi:MAG: exopolysaccharide Pel transporter PelG [Ectobacillus sp.]
MAGIGFKMQQLFKKDYFSSRIRAYGFSSLVTAGPWLVVIVTITLIQWLVRSSGILDQQVRELFIISISYCFIFSQVIFGTQQLIVTRYIADLFYMKKTEEVYSAFLGTSKVVTVMAVLLWSLFALYSPLPFVFTWLLLILFVIINLIWVLFLFLTAAKYYQPLAYSFIAGGMTALAATFWIVQQFDFSSFSEHFSAFLLIGAFTLGMLVTLVSLFFALLISFPKRGTDKQFSYFHYYDRFPSLFWTGFLYNMGIWVCSWVIWFGEGSSYLENSFRYHNLYDTAMFWSYLSIIPTMIIFVISIETRFYQRYRTFYGYINGGGSLKQILEAKEHMQLVLRQEMERLLRNQGVFSLAVLALVLYYAEDAGLEGEFVWTFCITVIGAFANGMVLVITLLLLYFEDRRGALYTTIIFFALNLLLSLLLLPLGTGGYGLSFAIGSSVAFGFSAWRLIQYVSEIDFHAFTAQNAHKRSERTFFTEVGKYLNKMG